MYERLTWPMIHRQGNLTRWSRSHDLVDKERIQMSQKLHVNSRTVNIKVHSYKFLNHYLFQLSSQNTGLNEILESDKYFTTQLLQLKETWLASFHFFPFFQIFTRTQRPICRFLCQNLLFAHSLTALNVRRKFSMLGTKWRISSVTRQPKKDKQSN